MGKTAAERAARAIMNKGRILESLQAANDAEETRRQRREELGPHPVAIAIRDISIGLVATGAWDDFVHFPSGRLSIQANALEDGDRTLFDHLQVRGWRPGTAAREVELTKIVRTLLIRRGCTEASLSGNADIIPAWRLPTGDISAHERLAIITEISALLREIETSSLPGK